MMKPIYIYILQQDLNLYYSKQQKHKPQQKLQKHIYIIQKSHLIKSAVVFLAQRLLLLEKVYSRGRLFGEKAGLHLT